MKNLRQSTGLRERIAEEPDPDFTPILVPDGQLVLVLARSANISFKETIGLHKEEVADKISICMLHTESLKPLLVVNIGHSFAFVVTLSIPSPTKRACRTNTTSIPADFRDGKEVWFLFLLYNNIFL